MDRLLSRPADLGGVAGRGFFLFRVFDVVKPFPIRRLERLPRRLGHHGRRRPGRPLRRAPRPRLSLSWMRIEIIAVGSELLTPEFKDTNSLYLTRRLNDLGWDPRSGRPIVGDDPGRADAEFIRDALGARRSPLHHGRTRTDRRRPDPRGLRRGARPEARLPGRRVLAAIRDRFRRRGRELPASNAKQAYVLEGAEVLENKNGTAPGQWLRDGGREFVLLPGPPRELEPMFEGVRLAGSPRARRGATGRRVLKIAGVGESDVETLIPDLYPPPGPLRLTILSSPGQIELPRHRVFEGRGRRGVSRTRGPVPDAPGASGRTRLFDRGRRAGGGRRPHPPGAAPDPGLRRVVHGRASRPDGSPPSRGAPPISWKDSSPTTTEPRSGAWAFLAELIRTHGAVSAEVAAAMAAGVRVAGPGATTVWPSPGSPARTAALRQSPSGSSSSLWPERTAPRRRRNVFFGPRELVRFQATQKALDMLRRRLLRPERS